MANYIRTCGRILFVARINIVTFCWRKNMNMKFFAIKFYLKNHADSEDRFKINALTIFGTCLRVMQGLVKEHPAASFFIFGSQSHKDKLNAPSQRFRIYQRMIENVFSPVNFYHYALSIRSIYLVLNKKNEEPEATLTYLTQMLEDNFELQLKDT